MPCPPRTLWQAGLPSHTCRSGAAALAGCCHRSRGKDHFFSPRDIADSGFGSPTSGIAIGRTIVRNILEQVSIAAGSRLVLATLLPLRAMG